MMMHRSSFSGTASCLAVMLVVLATGCRRDEVSVQRVPKEAPAPAAPAAASSMSMPAGHPPLDAGAPMAEPKWQTPDGWKEVAASGMSVARFTVPGQEGRDADVAVMAFPGAGGHDLDVINIFRERLSQAPLDEAGLRAVSREFVSGAGKGALYDMLAPATATNGEARLLVAVLPQGQVNWYFRMIGASDTVNQQLPAFEGLLKSVTLETPAEPTAAAPAAAPGAPTPAIPPLASMPPKPAAAPASAGGAAGKPVLEVPAGWTEAAPTPMVLARFTLGGAEGKAEVTVSSFPGDVGGLTANINRWRGQVGLAALGDEEARQSAKPVDIQGKQAMLVDMLGQKGGQKARLVGLIVPEAGRTWFYKMVGDDAVAEREKDNLVKLAQSAKQP